ncbi:MAG: DUF4198 domain-containing protein [Sulfitobacter sp.]
MCRTFISTFVCAVWASAHMAFAHEFWIEPLEFQAENNAAVVANLRNGQLFQGTALSFSNRSTTRIEAVMGDDVVPITGRLGDRPAIQLPPMNRDGLLILAHEAARATVTYKDWPEFEAFAAHKDFTTAAEVHEARGWPKENFKETYTRHSKSLIALGSGEGADHALGLATEFVALDNPYAQGFDGVFDVELLYQGAPRPNAQIEVYMRNAKDEVQVSITRTDGEGRASIPVTAGMEYMLDAVVLRPFEGQTSQSNSPVWETLWASITFAVPAH